MVPENIQTLTTEGFGISMGVCVCVGVGGGGGGVRDPGNSRGEWGWTIKITFQGDNFELSTKIATY